MVTFKCHSVLLLPYSIFFFVIVLDNISNWLNSFYRGVHMHNYIPRQLNTLTPKQFKKAIFFLVATWLCTTIHAYEASLLCRL